MPDAQGHWTLDSFKNLRWHVVTFGQPAWRLFLLCEGNGDGTGIHFLDIKDHKGYELHSANEFIMKCAGHLRLMLGVRQS